MIEGAFRLYAHPLFGGSSVPAEACKHSAQSGVCKVSLTSNRFEIRLTLCDATLNSHKQ